jgi:exonuclease III
MTFLFWNINKREIYAKVAAASSEHGADVVVLTELPDDPFEVLFALNEHTDRPFEWVPSIDETLPHLFVRFPAEWVTMLRDSSRQRIAAISLPGVDEFILSIVHLPSKLHAHEDDQSYNGRILAELICEVENERGHARTIACGDFNMAPFEGGIMHVDAMNAVMTKQLAKKETRNHREKEYPYFYNPMWNLLGDERGVPGSYFYSPKHLRSEFWYLFDQVLPRPAMLTFFSGEVAIIDTIAGTSLLKNGVPDSRNVSDHLPLVFTLNF